MKCLSSLLVAGAVVMSLVSLSADAPQAPAADRSGENSWLKTAGATLAGTIIVAPGAPSPIVVLIAGSGPTDRDGNSAVIPGKNNSLKMLADALAAQGISSLRYDKRGIAASRVPGQNEADLRFEQLIQDAENLVGELKKDKRFTRVVVAGHSEGSLVGMVAARNAGAHGFVSLEGPGRPAGVVIREQLRPQIGEVPALWTATDSVLSTLEAGKNVDSLPDAISKVPPLASLFRASVQPFMISWLKYDPSKEIAKLSVPILIVQGTTDIQVSKEDADLLAKAAPKATL